MRRFILIFALLLATPALPQDDIVFRLESFLDELGYAPGTVDNVPDAATYEAVARYQKDRGLPVTGGMSLEEFQGLEREIILHRQKPKAQVQTATSTSAGRTTYHQLPSCTGQLGLMLFNYRPMPTNTKTTLEISDICWHKNESRLDASERMPDLTLVSSVDGFERYEVLSSGAADWQRNSVWLTRDTSEHNGENTEWATNVLFNTNTKTRSTYHNTLLWGGGGFVTSARFAPNEAQAPFNISFEISMGPQHKMEKACGLGEHRSPSYVTLKTQFDLRTPAVVSLVGAEATSGKAQGSMDLQVSPEGKISGNAKVYFENPRIAGHAPCEWLRAEVTIDTILGLTSGSKGTHFLAVGAGSGRYTDVNGNTFPLYAAANVAGFVNEVN